MRHPFIIPIVLTIQLICALFFVADIVATVFGLRTTPIPWNLRELLEILAAIGLVLGVILGALALVTSRAQRQSAENRLRRASSAFADVLAERFEEWSLTPAERDVALFLLKGSTIAQVAELRQTSEGTVKAQSGAIYRKAGVNSASQLLSLFIDDLMDEEVTAHLRTP